MRKLRGCTMIFAILLILFVYYESCHGIAEFAAPPLKIAAFNVQVFGSRKMKDGFVAETLTKIISRYDIIAIQEIRDSSQTAFPLLVDYVQRFNAADSEKKYGSVISARLGRTTSKEQYGFIFRSDVVTVKEVYQAVDSRDVFQREPYAVRFNAPGKEVEDFGIMVIHTQPDEAVKEIDALVDEYDKLAAHWGTKEILLAGDFNADCDYVKGDDWLKVRLHTEKRFKWLINTCSDTTTKSTQCAYDRFVTAGTGLTNAVVEGSAHTFRFDIAYGLTEEQTIRVSDHYPIEIKLEGKPNRSVQRKIDAAVSFMITSKDVSPDAILQIKDGYFNIEKLYSTSQAVKWVVAKKSLVRNLATTMERFRSDVGPGILSDAVISGITAFESTVLDPTYVYGVKDDYYYTLNVEIMCDVDERQCRVMVYRRARLL